MRRLVLLLVTVVALAACGDNKVPAAKEDAGPPPIDAAVDGPPVVNTGPCLDRPTDMPLPPSGQLPCELLPPGFQRP
jgi:hypothetical protein